MNHPGLYAAAQAAITLDHDSAFRLVEPIVRLDKPSADALLIHAWTCPDHSSRLESLRKASELYPDEPLVQTGLSWIEGSRSFVKQILKAKAHELASEIEEELGTSSLHTTTDLPECCDYDNSSNEVLAIGPVEAVWTRSQTCFAFTQPDGDADSDELVVSTFAANPSPERTTQVKDDGREDQVSDDSPADLLTAQSLSTSPSDTGMLDTYSSIVWNADTETEHLFTPATSQPAADTLAEFAFRPHEEQKGEHQAQLREQALRTLEQDESDPDCATAETRLLREVHSDSASLQPHQAREIRPADPARDPTKPQVLVVDDSPTICKLVTMILRTEFDVITAADGIEALTQLARITPDIILTDIMMPRLDGYKLCKYVKKHQRTKDVPVILWSANDSLLERARGKMLGCSGYLTKPFDSTELPYQILKVLAAARFRKSTLASHSATLSHG